MWLGVRHTHKKALELFSREIAPAGTGMGESIYCDYCECTRSDVVCVVHMYCSSWIYCIDWRKTKCVSIFAVCTCSYMYMYMYIRSVCA